jgi:hypothetical protein
MVAILGPRGEDEVREREGEYRHAEEESMAILCMGSSVCRLSSAGAIHSRMMSRRSPCCFMSPVP